MYSYIEKVLVYLIGFDLLELIRTINKSLKLVLN